jgi:ribosomal protein L5
MYNTWTEITHRDLIQKGGLCKDLKELNVDKVVLKMSLTKKDGGMVYEKKGLGKKTSKNKGSGSVKGDGRDLEEKKRLIAEGSNENLSSLTLLSLLAILSGQRPALTYARKSIANWKIRKGQLLGCKVSLRGPAALAFLDKTIRFQNLNTEPFWGGDQSPQPNSRIASSSEVGGSSPQPTSEGVVGLNAQGLGNLSLGINNLHLYPELDSLWIQIANIFGHQNLGLDLALAFKNTKKFSTLVKSLSQKGSLTRHSSKGGHSLNKVYLRQSSERLSSLVQLRKLYLTSLGLVISFRE